ncbi:MAG TPA: metal-dependent hydrolase [Acidobacteriota bacterium]
MASPVGHTLGAYAVWIALRPEILSDPRKNRIAAGSAFIFGNLADADFAVAHFTANPVWGHHYFSHSVFFALAFALICFLLLRGAAHRNSILMGLTIGCAYGAHLLLDFFTADGSPPFGIPLLWPLSDHHFLFSPSIFYATHRGSLQALFSVHNLMAMLIELALLFPIVLLLFFWRRKRGRG